MDSPSDPLWRAVKRRVGIWGLVIATVAPALLFSGCMMTPEDKAFYGRGWINPDELDQDQPPPRAFSNPTDVQPHMMGPGEY